MQFERNGAAFASAALTTCVEDEDSNLTGLAAVLKSEVDISAGYSFVNDNTVGSQRISETMFYELAHAAHYNKVGNSWWADFVNAELSEIIGNQPPYGTGNNSNSPIIALGESWAFHVGHFMADMKYGANSGPVWEQNVEYRNGPILENNLQVANTGLNAHLNLLEDFSPNRPIDPFRWIPQGLFYDLMDDRNDNLVISPARIPLDDIVFGYTNFMFFNALDTDVRSLQNFRLRLLSENHFNQSDGLTAIFTFYGY